MDQSTKEMADRGASFEIKCWGGGWGLPSIDSNCLSVIAYGHLAKATMNVQPTLPKYTITGVMPELQMGDFVYSQAFSIFGIFRRDGYNADYHLTANQHADTFAFLSYIEQKLKPALLFNLWMDTANYTKVTRPAYARACGLPWSLWYPRKLRQTVMDQLTQTYEGYRGNLAELEKFVYKNAFECLNVLEKKLGEQSYFFGNSPSTMDAVIYGHLAILLRAPLVSTGLQNHLNSCEKLRNLCFRIEKSFAKYPHEAIPRNPTNTSGKGPLMRREQFLTLIGAVAAMVTYVMTSGVLTSRRSRLAQKLGTVTSPQRNYVDVMHLDDDDDE